MNAALQPSIADRLDRLPVNHLHLAVVAVCAFGFMFDLAELAMGSALSAVLSTPPHAMAPQQLSWLLASVYLGAAIGAPLLGRVGDRRGRRIALAGVLLWLAPMSLGVACSEQSTGLIAFRLLSGLALGAYPPLMVAYLTDMLPPHRRGKFILFTVAFASLGPPAVMFFIRAATPLQPFGMEAWRCAFAIGSVGAALGGLLFLRLPESPRWLASVGRLDAAEAACRQFEMARPMGAPAPAVLATPVIEPATSNNQVHRRHFALTAALSFLSPWATVAFPLLSGAALVAKGFALTDTLLLLGISMLGPVLTTFASAWIADRIERRTALFICAAAMAVLALVFGAATSKPLLLASNLAFSLFGSLYASAVPIYTAELFPTNTRSSAAAGAWAVNRVASALAPLLLLPLLHEHGALPMFAVIAGALALSLLLIVAKAPLGNAGRIVQ